MPAVTWAFLTDPVPFAAAESAGATAVACTTGVTGGSGTADATGIISVAGSGTVPTGVADAVGRVTVAASAASCPPSRLRWILFLCFQIEYRVKRTNTGQKIYRVYEVIARLIPLIELPDADDESE